MHFSIAGTWIVALKSGDTYSAILPGTLDENKIGQKDVPSATCHPAEDSIAEGAALLQNSSPGVIASRLTRKYTYEGEAVFTKRIAFHPPVGHRVFLEVERARSLKLLVDGKRVEDFVEPTLSTPHIFEVTGLLNGNNEITLLSDNSYPGWPYEDILNSSAATDETQTNWNGLLGYLRLRTEAPVFLSEIRIYPKDGKLLVQAEISSDRFYAGRLTIRSEALVEPAELDVCISAGISKIELKNLRLKHDVRYWDEEEGKLYELTAGLSGFGERTVSFGIRTFSDNGKGRFALNGRTIFLRSEANCAVFPETGHAPMELEKWLSILEQYHSYGVNCVRFHSHCPPEAAFEAADQLGILLQPELSHWNPKNAFATEESFVYYRAELEQILRHLANHPSFVMLTLGNELWPSKEGEERIRKLLKIAHEIDTTRLYANGSNVNYGEKGCNSDSDFYASQGYYEQKFRGSFSEAGGYINREYPSASRTYDETLSAIRQTFHKPVFSFEVGQFEILPDFEELSEFKGVTDPANIRLIKERAQERGLLSKDRANATTKWKQYVEATGELSRIGYREEVEAAMRTQQLSGISLLGLQDFSGQGTALVGMMNSHLQPKPYPFAKPEDFRSFFKAQLPLVFLPRYTYESTDVLQAELKIANYGKYEIVGSPIYQLEGGGTVVTGELPEVRCEQGELTSAGVITIPFKKLQLDKAVQLELTVTLKELTNTYPIWIYPPVKPVCPKNVYETEQFDEKTLEVLKAGGRVYLSPPSTQEALPPSIQAQFTTDFWSVGTFPKQQGGMGQFIDVKHPLFEHFPTQMHTNWQWWPMATQRAVILPQHMKAIITEMDSYAFMRNMAQLFECRCEGGTLLFSSIGLQNLQQYPEARALLDAIYQYLASDKFEPEQEVKEAEWRKIWKK